MDIAKFESLNCRSDRLGEKTVHQEMEERTDFK